MSFLDKILGTPSDAYVKKVAKTIAQVNAEEATLLALNNGQLQAKTTEFKDRLAKGETLDEILPEAFAVVREASKRLLNQRHFDVQLIGGLALHQGKISEMKTQITAPCPTACAAMKAKMQTGTMAKCWLKKAHAVSPSEAM